MGIFDQDNQPFDEEGLARHIDKALDVQRPQGIFYELSYPLLRRLFRPKLVQADNIPDEPCLFVGNHSLFALDGMVLSPVMFHELGRFLRALGDKFLWNSVSEDILLGQGAVIGHPEVCSALMEAGEDLVVFPGGAHESTKTEAQRHTLQWKERHGFVRLAAKHGYTIMPMAIVGPDEFYDHRVEGRDLPDTRLGKLLTRMGALDENTRRDMLPPLPAGVLGTLIPKPQRFYIQFGQPVRLAQYEGKRVTKKKMMAIRAEVAEQIESMLVELQALRDEQRVEDGFLRRLLTR